ncbi:MAG: hypothetical protein IKO00_14495 [Oscillospiraceae bacterium]|nr:hypothetical protein [Oscillospiraceae bacterium]
MKETWIVFYGPDGKELCRYTARGSFAGELWETIALLAYEHGLTPEEISFAEVRR